MKNSSGSFGTRWEVPARRAYQEQVAARLRGLEQIVGDDRAPDQALLVIETVGDGLRMGEPLPRTVATWLKTLTVPSLAATLEEARAIIEGTDPALADSWPEPFHDPGPDSSHQHEAPDPALQWTVVQRDRAESLRVGLLRVCARKGLAPMDVPGFSEFLDAVEELDALLKQRLDREAAESLLGDRRWLLENDDWTRRLEEPRQAPEQAKQTKEAEGKAAAGAAAAEAIERGWQVASVPCSLWPPEEAVTAYAVHGKLAPWVEGMARDNAAFRQQLLDTLDALIALDAKVALRPRLFLEWEPSKASLLHKQPKLPELKIPLRVLPEVQLAAADRERGRELGGILPSALGPALAAFPGGATLRASWGVRPAGQGAGESENRGRELLLVVHPLGRLYPVKADATLYGYPDRVELRVVAEQGTLARVEFGSGSASGPGPNGVWVVTATREAVGDSVRLCVADTRGEKFEVLLKLEAVGSDR